MKDDLLSEFKRTQKLAGEFLFLAQMLDNTLLQAPHGHASDAIKATGETLEAAICFLNHIATKIRFRARDMILQLDADAAFQIRPEARS